MNLMQEVVIPGVISRVLKFYKMTSPEFKDYYTKTRYLKKDSREAKARRVLATLLRKEFQIPYKQLNSYMGTSRIDTTLTRPPGIMTEQDWEDYKTLREAIAKDFQFPKGVIIK